MSSVTDNDEAYEAAEKFVTWLQNRLIESARGDHIHNLSVEPSGRFWLGRVAPEEMVAQSPYGDKADRLEPCAIGMKVLPKEAPPWNFNVTVKAAIWVRLDKEQWEKRPALNETLHISVSKVSNVQIFGTDIFTKKLEDASGVTGLSAELSVEWGLNLKGQEEVFISFVNKSPEKMKEMKDTRFYETSMEISGIKTSPYQLETLHDSFRYDRDIHAYGHNCGIHVDGNGNISAIDTPVSSKFRPKYWNINDDPPDMRFSTLAENPLASSKSLYALAKEWGEEHWNKKTLEKRAHKEAWSDEMLSESHKSAEAFAVELDRINKGINILETNELLRKSFVYMNKAMLIAAAGKYDGWRPFQFGFLLANLACIAEPENESDIVDIVWFATGGGKTETYLGLLLTAAFYDRLRGKKSGITAWSRFPLRMLSLQQTQRFADALAAAEQIRSKEKIEGDQFSLGFFVGANSTPNKVEADHKTWDSDDPNMPKKAKVLSYCPFCKADSISMDFNLRHWQLVHKCTNSECSWNDKALPIFVVDDEIYRFLPTVIVGTLDKAALIAMQASMRGFVGAPWGKCSKDGHGFTYAIRSKKPNGCLVPDCNGTVEALPNDPELFGPSFRLQDELHLLRDSLGAVDAFYESLFDNLEQELCGYKPKILASSATLSGYEKQSQVLYSRQARVFPEPGPAYGQGFWTADSEELMRKFIAISPKGVTLEFAVDRLLTELQKYVRQLLIEPEKTCSEIGVDPKLAPFLLDLYGTNVVYGNTLRDLDAVMRSTETQLGDIEGTVNVAQLTGKTDFEEIRRTLDRLEHPEEDFFERLHVIPASSMMSHGVDIDRLNTMIMIGLPLGTAEFIQSTARVGRKWPALVLVVHKISRERDASIYRSFDKFIEHGDRFVEPIPITRNSRRVLERTIAGLEFARLLMIHEPQADTPLTMIPKLREYINKTDGFFADEIDVICDMLKTNGELNTLMKDDIEKWFRLLERNVDDPPTDSRFASDLSPHKAMRSLRDVEEQAKIVGSELK